MSCSWWDTSCTLLLRFRFLCIQWLGIYCCEHDRTWIGWQCSNLRLGRAPRRWNNRHMSWQGWYLHLFIALRAKLSISKTSRHSWCTTQSSPGRQSLPPSIVPHLNDISGEFTPDIVLYDAGVDVFFGDRLGNLDLTLDGIFKRDCCVLEHFKSRNIPIATVIGGGYDPLIPKSHSGTYLYFIL